MDPDPGTSLEKKNVLRIRIYFVVMLLFIHVNVWSEICVNSGRKSLKRLV